MAWASNGLELARFNLLKLTCYFIICLFPCSCDEFDGEPLAHVFLHHSGRRLGVLTKRSRLLALETRSLSRAEQFTGVRCREAPIKAAFSPGGCGPGGAGLNASTAVPLINVQVCACVGQFCL